MTLTSPLFEGDTRERHFHIVWDSVLESRHRKCLFKEVANAEKRIRKMIERKTRISEEEALLAYSKRDCVEKVFMALKSFLGMDKIGTQSDESIHAKSLIWFVAAILHSLLFTGTKDLRVSDRKTFTVPSVGISTTDIDDRISVL